MQQPSTRIEELPWYRQGPGRACHSAGLASPLPRRDADAGATHHVDCLAGLWVNMDSPYEQYSVDGFHVMRSDYRGTQHFTLRWDTQTQRLHWGIHGRLRLEWLGKNAIAWVPDSYNARVWRWQRCGPPYTPPVRTTAASLAPPPWMGVAVGGYGPLRRLRGVQEWEVPRPYGERPSHGATGVGQQFPFGFGGGIAPVRLSERVRPRDSSSGRTSHGSQNNRQHGRGSSRGRPSKRGSRHAWSSRSSSRRRHREQRHRRGEQHHRRYHVGRDSWGTGGLGRGGGRGSDAGPRLPCGLTQNEVYDLLSRDITPEDYELLLQLDEGVERKETASTESIEALPSVSPDEFADGECAVCMSPFEASDAVAGLPCAHYFHRGCIAKWLTQCKRTCPLCGVCSSGPVASEQ